VDLVQAVDQIGELHGDDDLGRGATVVREVAGAEGEVEDVTERVMVALSLGAVVIVAALAA
jgi:hypothetical protein